MNIANFITQEDLINLIPAHFYWLDKNNVYQGCNESQAATYKFKSCEEIIGKRNKDLPCFINKPELAKIIDDNNNQVMELGTILIFEETCFNENGEELCYITRKMPLRDNNGNIIGVVGISVDTTSTKKKIELEKQQAILSEEAKLRQIIDMVNASIYWKDKEGRYLGCNKSVLDILGLSKREEVVGKTDKELLPMDKVSKFVEIDNWVVKNGRYDGEEYGTFNGQEKVYLTSKAQLLDTQGEVIGIVGTSIDITDKKRNIELEKRQAIINEENKARQIIDLVGASIYWKDKEGHYLGCNKYVLNMFNFAGREEIIGKNDYALLPIEEANKISEIDKLVIREGFYQGEEDVTVATGKQNVYLTTKTRLLDSQGEIIGIVGTSLDITVQKEALAKVIQQQQARAESEENLRKVITTYAEAVAHNLRTPLVAQLMQVHFYEENIPLLLEIYEEAKALGSEKARLLKEDHIKALKESGDTLVECISNINEIIDNNLQSLNGAIKIHMGQASNIDLKECSIVENFMSDKFRSTCKDGKQLIYMDLDYHFKFKGNSISMDQVITNLTDNALYQIRKNGKGELFFKTEDGGNFNLLKVKDTAGGAPKQVVEKMFDSHFTTKHDGNGVGLDFCKKTMNLFGGDIIAHSVEGDYMEFILSFPKI